MPPRAAESAIGRGFEAERRVAVHHLLHFEILDLARLKAKMTQPVMVDLRNVYRPEDMEKVGFTYESVGRDRAEHS